MKCKASIEPFSIYLFIRLLAAVRQVFINSSVMLWFKIIEIHYQEKRERLYVLWCVMCKIIYRLHLLSKVDKTAFDSRSPLIAWAAYLWDAPPPKQAHFMPVLHPILFCLFPSLCNVREQIKQIIPTHSSI